MFEVDVALKVNASLERVWNIISKVDNDRMYWKEISRIKNLTRDRNGLTREAYLANGSKYNQKITFFPKEGIHIRWTRGTVTGVKDIMLIDNGPTTIVRVQINYKHGGAVHIGSTDILKKLRTETESALRLIKREAECQPYDTIMRK